MDFKTHLEIEELMRQITRYPYIGMATGIAPRQNQFPVSELVKLLLDQYQPIHIEDNSLLNTEWTFTQTDGFAALLEYKDYRIEFHQFNWKYVCQFIARNQIVLSDVQGYIHKIGECRFLSSEPRYIHQVTKLYPDKSLSELWYILGYNYITDRPDECYKPFGKTIVIPKGNF